MREFLSTTLEDLYIEAKKCNSTLRGIRAKKSFMTGIADGYLSKINTKAKNNFSKELIRCEMQVQNHLHRAYPRLRGRYSQGSGMDAFANDLGKSAGRNLTINPWCFFTNKRKQCY